MCHLHPLVYPEVGGGRLDERLRRGSLPAIVDSPIPDEDLHAYVGTYLKEEILAEGLTRNIGNFSRFLEFVGHTNTEQVNFSSLGSDAGLPPRTVQHYFQVLEDTLLGTQVLPYRSAKGRKTVATPKFYFFDVGVAHALVGRREITPGTEAYGKALEHLVFLELRAFLDYRRLRLPLTYWRTVSKLEVDFVLGDRVGIEVKGKERVGPGDLKGLRALKEELPLERALVVASEPWRRTTDDGIEIVPVEEFLEELWDGRIVR